MKNKNINVKIEFSCYDKSSFSDMKNEVVRFIEEQDSEILDFNCDLHIKEKGFLYKFIVIKKEKHSLTAWIHKFLYGSFK